MENKLLQSAKTYLRELEAVKNAQSSRIKSLEKYRDVIMRGKTSRGGQIYYSARKKTSASHKYLGDDHNDTVRKIKELRYLDEQLIRIEKNSELVQSLIDNIQGTDYESVNETLPNVYRNPYIGSATSRDKKQLWKEKAEALKSRYETYKPHELNIRTNDGSLVRSKSEALIYNYLLSLDIAFIYEMPIKTGGKLLVPDFTILSDVDFESEIIIEHQGMMDSALYRNRFAEKVYQYLCAGFIQGINIFYTFDDINGGLDISPVEDLVINRIIGR